MWVGLHESTVADEVSVWDKELGADYVDEEARKTELKRRKKAADERVQAYQRQQLLKLWDVILLHGRVGWLALLTYICKHAGRYYKSPDLPEESEELLPSSESPEMLAVDNPNFFGNDIDDYTYEFINTHFERLLHEPDGRGGVKAFDRELSKVYDEILGVKAKLEAEKTK